VNLLYPQSTRRNWAIFSLLVVLSVMIITLYFREGSNGILHGVQRYTVNIVVPLQSGVSKAVSPFKSAFRFVTSIGSMRTKNQRLEKENSRLRKEIASLHLTDSENKRLRELVGLKRKLDLSTAPAQVIGKSSTDWQAVIVLDKGRNEGVKKNMPVIVDSGLVGQVIDSSPKACRVQLITDQKSGVGVQIISTSETGVLQGQIDEKLKISFIDKNSKVKKGDEVVTSGLGGIFPKGLYVGKVRRISSRPYSLFKEIEVESFVEFAKLEEVLIITNPFPRNPYETKER